MSHTPIPWQAHPARDGADAAMGLWTLIKGADGKYVASTSSQAIANGRGDAARQRDSEANADFIVLAVNAHDSLLAAAIFACEELSERITGATDGQDQWMAECVRQLQNAILKAGGAVPVPGSVK